MTLTTLIIYLFLQFALCFYISRKIKSEADYLVAGRSFPLIVVAVSLFATWFGAETCIGSSGAVYAEGLSGSRADPFGYSLCLVLSGLLIAGRMWNKKYMTLSDFYKDRFGAPVEQLAVWILSLSSLIWAAAQLRAFGQVISATTNLDLDTTLLIGTVCVISYTLLGGLMGDMITDLVQAVVIGVGLMILFVVIFLNVPDWNHSLSQISPERWSILGQNESWLERIDRWAIPIFGSLVAQEIISRIFAARSKTIAVKACYVGAAIYIGFGLIPVFLGLIGPQLIQVEGDSEQFLIQLAKTYMSPVLVGIFAGALISALLATLDSILLAVAALISHNFLVPRFKIEGHRSKILTSRLVVLAAGLAAYILATYAEGIYALLEIASTFGTAGILIITLVGLWTSFGGMQSALAALLVGLVSTPIAKYVLNLSSPFLLSILLSGLAYFALGRIQKNMEVQ